MKIIGEIYFIKDGKTECKDMYLSEEKLNSQKVSGFYRLIKLYSDEELNKNVKKDYLLYQKELKEGITVVRKVNKTICDLGNIIVLDEYYIDIYIPEQVSEYDNMCLKNILKQFDRNKNFFYITNLRNDDYDFYDWNYNKYINNVDISLICDYYYREKLGVLTKEEKELFMKYRNLDMKQIILEDFKKYPLNNNNTGIILFTYNKEIKKAVTKSNHKNEILSEIEKLGFLPEQISYVELVSIYNLVLILITKDSVIGYINSDINDYQKNLLYKQINEIKKLKVQKKDLVCGCNLILNGNIVYDGDFEELIDIMKLEIKDETLKSIK